MTSTLPTTPRALTQDTLRVLRARLEIQRDFRVDQLAALQSMSPIMSSDGERDAVHDEIVTSLCRGAENALRETRQALWRLDEDCYGHCCECFVPLDLEQLAAVPQAARCPSCEQNLHLA